MDTATWCAATRRATPPAIPGRCASRATAGTGAAPPTTRASTASTCRRAARPRARGGRLGFNAVWLIETGEEAGSPGLAAFCEARRDELAADVFLASDGSRLHAERPTLLRARARYFEASAAITQLGRAASNPAIVLAHAIATLVDARASRCPARPPPIPLAVAGPRPSWTGGGADDPASAHWGEPGLSARKGVRLEQPDVLTFGAGDPAASTPSRPRPLRGASCASWSARTGARWKPMRDCPPGSAQVRIRLGAQAGATRLSPDNALGPLGRGPIERSTGKRPARCPTWAARCPTTFADLLGLPTICAPLVLRRAQHAPNEHLLGSVAREGLGHHGRPVQPTWATRTGPCATPPRPFDPDAETTSCPSRPAPPQRPVLAAAAGARRRTPPIPNSRSRSPLHAGRRDRLGGAPAGQRGRQAQPVIIENRPGASTVIGAEAVPARDPTAIVVSAQHHLFRAAALKTDLPYDPLRSYEHIAIVSLAPLAAGARLRQHGRRSGRAGPQAERQGELMYGTFGPGSAPHRPARCTPRPPAPE